MCSRQRKLQCVTRRRRRRRRKIRKEPVLRRDVGNHVKMMREKKNTSCPRSGVKRATSFHVPSSKKRARSLFSCPRDMGLSESSRIPYQRRLHPMTSFSHNQIRRYQLPATSSFKSSPLYLSTPPPSPNRRSTRHPESALASHLDRVPAGSCTFD